MRLLQRFYDPKSGRILLDGIDIRKLNIKWLRSQIGMVSQEPKLFNDTIYKNIALGKEGCKKRHVVTAARIAFAHEFITALPKVKISSTFPLTYPEVTYKTPLKISV